MQIILTQCAAAGAVLDIRRPDSAVRYGLFRNRVSDNLDSYGIINNGEPMH